MRGLDVAPYTALHALRPSRVWAFPGGRLALVSGGERSGVTVPILAYLLETDTTRILVDSGLEPRWRDAADVQEAPEDVPGAGSRYIPELDDESVAEQVRGRYPDRFFCTHLHHDHSGGAAAVGLPLEVARPELDRALGADAAAQGYPVDLLRQLRLAPFDLDPGRPIGPFRASVELTPDVIAVDTSGHTPGSTSLLVRLRGGLGLICGDAVYPLLDEPRSPAYLGMLRIRRALLDLDDLVILPGHDTAVLRAAGGEAGI